MPAYELTFKLPFTELNDTYKDKVRCFRNHGFCIVELECMLDPVLTSAHQLEAFRCAIREHCNEQDRELIIDEDTMAPNIIFELAPHGHKGTQAEEWSIDDEIASALAKQAKLDAKKKDKAETPKRWIQ